MTSKRKRSPKKKAGKAVPAPVLAPPAGVPEGLPEEDDDGFVDVELSGPHEVKRSGRRIARVPVQQRVEISGFFSPLLDNPLVTDVSLGGLFVETARVLEVGDPVRLGIVDGHRKLRVTGRVRWVTPFGGLHDARPGMGIELVGASETERTRIFDLLRGRAPEERLRQNRAS